VTPKEHAQKQ
jgi:hypothetical protein